MNKMVYWVIQLTWGLITTLLGLFSAVVLKAFGFKWTQNGYGVLVIVGSNWGGLSLGPFSFCDQEECETTRKHEYGHSIQNMIFGPLWIIVIGIPSFIRYWYYMLNSKADIDKYDDIWFEHTATIWGTRAIDKYEQSQN